MPSQPIDTGWDFDSVIDLIDSDIQNASSTILRPSLSSSLASALQEDGGLRLGSFAKLYESLGFIDIPLHQSITDSESELSISDDALVPSPVQKGIQMPKLNANDLEDEEAASTSEKDVELAFSSAARVDRQSDLLNTTAMSKKQRKKAKKAKKQAKQGKKKSPIVPPKETTKSKQVQALADSTAGENSGPETPSRKPRKPKPTVMGVEKWPPGAVRAETEMQQEECKTSPPSRSISSNSPSHSNKHAIDEMNTIVHVSSLTLAQPATTEQPPPLAPQHTPPNLSPSFQESLAAQYSAQLHPPQISKHTRQHHMTTHLMKAQAMATDLARVEVGSCIARVPARLHFPTPVHSWQAGTRSQVDRHVRLFNKLFTYFPDDQRWLVAPKQLVNESTSRHGLHVFVDTSNIMYGFKDALRRRGLAQCDMSFDSLALLMERRRPVAKRVSAGSHREAHPVPQVARMFETWRAVGYESNVKEQVLIVREDSERKKFFNDAKKLGWHRAQELRWGSNSDSETSMAVAGRKTAATAKWVEQGVDELLHLKMCQSIIDTETPSTMVLATGDGAEAEMSDGFLAHVERALKKGWKMELVSWRQPMNGGYRNRTFRAKWADQFTIIELDDFLEDMMDTG